MSKKPTAAPSPEQRRSISGWVIAGIAAAVVAVAAIVAVVSTSDEPASVPGLSQTAPVSVAGTPLPEFASGASDPAIGTVAPTLVGSAFDGS